MTRLINSIGNIVSEFDVAVLDQYGVLHNGISAYEGAIQAVDQLSPAGKHVVILSNSGKRSDFNRRRVEKMGFRLNPSVIVETSGEAAWRDLHSGGSGFPTPVCLFPIESQAGDAQNWAKGSDRIRIVSSLNKASALLLMGIPPDGTGGNVQTILARSRPTELPLICINPDRTATSGDGLTLAPGVLADQYTAGGGTVIWYGKPHRTVFDHVRQRFADIPAGRFLMVGDSLTHDIMGGKSAGFATCFVRAGIHSPSFQSVNARQDIHERIESLCGELQMPHPDYSLDTLR